MTLKDNDVAVLLSTPFAAQLNTDEKGFVTLSVVVGTRTAPGEICPINSNTSSQSVAVQTTGEVLRRPEKTLTFASHGGRADQDLSSVAHTVASDRKSSSEQPLHVQDNGYQYLADAENVDVEETSFSSKRQRKKHETVYPFGEEQSAKLLMREIESLEANKTSTEERLSDLNASWTRRRQPYETELVSLKEQIEEKQEQLQEAQKPKDDSQTPPGPASLRFVSSDWFSFACSLMIFLNAVSMLMDVMLTNSSVPFVLIDNLFLTWYVLELILKITYYRSTFVFGAVSVVCWSWLDIGIVVAGVIDQWLLPLLTISRHGHARLNACLRMLRLLRMFRLLRLLKLARAVLSNDLAWTNGTRFELFMAFVIAFNAIIMALELDYPWFGWHLFEHVLLAMYSFELALRLKRDGWYFFTHYSDWIWHYLDFVNVLGGVLDLWLTPLIHVMSGYLNHPSDTDEDELSKIVRLLKILRILRVLRLVRLVKAVKPLYILLLGVLESVQAMQWVIVLAFMTIYACAIVFTSLLGRGLATNGEVSKSAEKAFGYVTRSLFSLFRLMNGDLTVTQEITDYVVGQLLIVCFVVISNWAILAILTAVVADNMIITSKNTMHDLNEKKRKDDLENRTRRLRVIFDEIDEDGSGSMTTMEWQAMMGNPDIRDELCDATGFSPEELNDYFDCLSEFSSLPPVRGLVAEEEKNIDFTHFLEMLNAEGNVADKRCIWHVLSEIRALQSSLEPRRSISLHSLRSAHSVRRSKVSILHAL